MVFPKVCLQPEPFSAPDLCSDGLTSLREHLTISSDFVYLRENSPPLPWPSCFTKCNHHPHHGRNSWGWSLIPLSPLPLPTQSIKKPSSEVHLELACGPPPLLPPLWPWPPRLTWSFLPGVSFLQSSLCSCQSEHVPPSLALSPSKGPDSEGNVIPPWPRSGPCPALCCHFDSLS